MRRPCGKQVGDPQSPRAQAGPPDTAPAPRGFPSDQPAILPRTVMPRKKLGLDRPQCAAQRHQPSTIAHRTPCQDVRHDQRRDRARLFAEQILMPLCQNRRGHGLHPLGEPLRDPARVHPVHHQRLVEARDRAESADPLIQVEILRIEPLGPHERIEPPRRVAANHDR
jgi:hypothetical protein